MSNYEQTAFAREIIARLRGYIARYDLNQADLAALCDVSQSQFSKILRGVRPMTLDQLAAICGAMDVELDQLVGEVEEFLADRDELASPVSYVLDGVRRTEPHRYENAQLDPWAAAARRRSSSNVTPFPNVRGNRDDDFSGEDWDADGEALDATLPMAAKDGVHKADQEPSAE
ncbi:helix-turn-helix domain-containing protein [Microbacterium hydrocarbonoxydans]|uniref:helix-turn-helix domain-containing protein n=1 Tax=Microbacterium hydrocarbonoxydans TaxID=273678 RepID=UPI003D96F131